MVKDHIWRPLQTSGSLETVAVARFVKRGKRACASPTLFLLLPANCDIVARATTAQKNDQKVHDLCRRCGLLISYGSLKRSKNNDESRTLGLLPVE